MEVANPVVLAKARRVRARANIYDLTGVRGAENGLDENLVRLDSTA